MTNHAIYQSKGSAAEYAKWACNFVVGCPILCQYCFNKTGRFKGVLGGEVQTLKKCFKDEKHALDVFENELSFNIVELQKHGLFFTFTSDPFAEPFRNLHSAAWGIAVHKYDVNVTVLTKMAGWIDDFLWWMNNSNSDNASLEWRRNICFGMTLTGCDDKEPGASTNDERIEGLIKLHQNGFRTMVSLEPVIDFDKSLDMVAQTVKYCDHYKIGLQSGQKVDMPFYNRMKRFHMFVMNYVSSHKCTVYWKDSFTKHGKFEDNVQSVDMDYNIFHE